MTSRYEQLEASLTNHTPTEEQVERIERIRASAKVLGLAVCDGSNPSREQSLALTHLEETTMWAVKAIVLEGK